MTCYRFRGPAHWIVHGLQLGFGIALSLLGLLDIGSDAVLVTQHDNDIILNRPMYTVVVQDMGLAVVFIAYTVVVLGSSVSQRLVAWLPNDQWLTVALDRNY